MRPATPATLANLDAAEDESAEHIWCWELRDLRCMPKAARPGVEPHRKLRRALQDRLRAAAAFRDAAAVHGASKALEAKVARAAARLRKLPGLEAARTQLRAALDAAGSKPAAGDKRAGKAAATPDAAAPAAAAGEQQPAAAAGAEAGEPMDVDRAPAEAVAAASTQPEVRGATQACARRSVLFVGPHLALAATSTQSNHSYDDFNCTFPAPPLVAASAGRHARTRGARRLAAADHRQGDC